MVIDTLQKLWDSEYVRTSVMVVLIVLIVFGFWYGLQAAANTSYPALAVASGSMCMQDSCDGWLHPFRRTLHVGDLIIIQGVDPDDINALPYPDGDIIVFWREAELIVHRAIRREEGGFVTKGDGNSIPDYGTVPPDQVVGRVVMRVPWIGHVALFMRNSSGVFVIVFLIIVLVIVEFMIPEMKGMRSQDEQSEIGKEEAVDLRLYKSYRSHL